MIRKWAERQEPAMGGEEDFFGRRQGSMITGAICFVLSVIGYFWLQSHAPGDFYALLMNKWVLREGPYYSMLAIDLLVGIYGIINLARAIRSGK